MCKKLIGWGSLLLCLLSCTDNAPAAGYDDLTLKVATYNLWCSHSRTKKLSADDTISPQRYWKPSSQAVASIVKEMDCDIFAFQEIGDSIFGKKGQETSLKKFMGDEYEWKIWSNKDGALVTQTAGTLTYSPGICYRKSVVTVMDGGVFWLGGNPATPEFVRTEDFDPQYGDPKRACVWARVYHKSSGRIFYFLSTHLDTRSFSGVSYPMVNNMNCMSLMDHADRFVVPEGVPSIIAGDMNTSPSNSGGYNILVNHEGRRHTWQDAYEMARQNSVLGGTASDKPVTVNSSKGVIGTSRIDHVFVEDFEVLNYDINQKKYKTENGEEHYPSDHFPVIVTLKFKNI